MLVASAPPFASLGGGAYAAVNLPATALTHSTPMAAGDGVPTGWRVIASNGTNSPQEIGVYVTCAKLS